MRNWLKCLRNKKKLSQQNVAEKLGITQQYYNLIENGERQPKMTIELADKLSKVFGVPIEYIMEQEK